MSTFTIIGAGYLGSALAIAAKALQMNVIGINKNNINPHCHTLLMDLNSSAVNLPESEYAVCCIPPRGDYSNYHQIIENIATRLAASDSQPRVVFVSSTGVFDQMHELINDHTQPNPQTQRGQSLLKAEQLFKEIYPPVTIIRPSRIYGPGRLGMLKNVQDNKAPTCPPQQYSHHIAVDDLAQIILMQLSETNDGQTLIASDPYPQKTVDIYHWLKKPYRLTIDTNQQIVKGVKYIEPSTLIAKKFAFKHTNVFEGYINFMQNTEH